MKGAPNHETVGFWSRLGRLIWSRPFIFIVGAVVGLALGLYLPVNDDGPQAAPGPAKTPAAAVAPAAAAVPPRTVPLTRTRGGAATPTTPEALAQLARASMSTGAGRPLTVGVFGDSLGDGVWAALYRQLRDGKTFDVVRFSQVSTGLSRYNYVDVHAKTQGQLAARHVDIAVLMFGANDQQGIVDGGGVYAFGTEGWKAAYGRRVDGLIDLLRGQGAVVYWMGLPRMERASFDRGASLINAVLEQHMLARGVRFVPTVPQTVDADGDYAAYLADPGAGKPRLMRANDGIHMSMAGYLRIAAPVAALIRADLAAAQQTLPAPATVAAPPAVVPPSSAAPSPMTSAALSPSSSAQP